MRMYQVAGTCRQAGQVSGFGADGLLKEQLNFLEREGNYKRKKSKFFLTFSIKAFERRFLIAT